ncbi:MAG: MarR family winged helix-turn-helix transcriptional regulator [Bacteroidia bacterium]
MYIYLCPDSTNMELEKEIQQGKFKSNRHKAVLNILFTSGWLTCQQQRFFKDHEISPQQYNVLRILRGQKGKPITVNGIQDRMLDKNSNASRLIDKLKEKKLVDRVICENDRRQVDILITENGMTFLKKIDSMISELESSQGNITEKEAEELNRILDKLRG